MDTHQITIVLNRRHGMWSGVIVSTTHDMESLAITTDGAADIAAHLRALADRFEHSPQ